jgi:hypothetical protein
MSDTTEPAPLTEREMNQFITLAALPTLERALERLRWLEAEVATRKAHDPLADRDLELRERFIESALRGAARDSHMLHEASNMGARAVYMADSALAAMRKGER